jgi:hypothetical protein
VRAGQRLGCERSFITAIADELERKALIRRELDPADRRHRNIVLTEQGAAVRARLEAEFFGRLPWRQALDDQQRASFLSLLTAVLNPPGLGHRGTGPVSFPARARSGPARGGGQSVAVSAVCFCSTSSPSSVMWISSLTTSRPSSTALKVSPKSRRLILVRAP